MQEKRQHQRVPLNVPVRFKAKDGQEDSGVAKDISVGGVFIEAETSPAFGAQVDVTIRLPGMTGDSVLSGTVRWNKPGGFGVQFGLMGVRETHAITQLLQKR